MSQFKLRKAIVSRVVGSKDPKIERITYPSTETPGLLKRSLTWVKEGSSLIVNIHEIPPSGCYDDRFTNKDLEIMACMRSANRIKEVSTLANIRSLSLTALLWNQESDFRIEVTKNLVKSIISGLEKIEILSLDFQKQSGKNFSEWVASLIIPKLRTLRSLTLKCCESYHEDKFLVKFLENVGLNLPLLEKLHIIDNERSTVRYLTESRGPVKSTTIAALIKQIKYNLRSLKHLILDFKRFRFSDNFEIIETLFRVIASRWRALETFHLYLHSKNRWHIDDIILPILTNFGHKLAENIKDFCFEFKPFTLITKNNKLISYTFGPQNSDAFTNQNGVLRTIVPKIKMPYFLDLVLTMEQEHLQIVSEQFKSSLQSLEKFDLSFAGCGWSDAGTLDSHLENFIDQLALNLNKLKELGIQFIGCNQVTDQSLMALTKQIRRKFDTLDLFQIVFPRSDSPQPNSYRISNKTIMLVFNELKAKLKPTSHFDLYFGQKIHISNKPDELIKKFVHPDLSHLNFEFFYSKNTDKLILQFFEKIQPHLSGIKSLHIGFSDYERITEETLIKILSLIGENLPFLVSLSLDFSECKNITDETSKALISHIKFTTLKVLRLNFSNCQEISDETIFLLADEISSKSDPLQSLALNFAHCTNLTDNPIAELAQCFNSLKNLHLVFDSCQGITDQSVKIIFENITTLQTLHLSFANCQSISDIAMLTICDISLKTMNTLINLENLKETCAEAKGAAKHFSNYLQKIGPGIKSLTDDDFDEESCGWFSEEARNAFGSFEKDVQETLTISSNIDKYKSQTQAVLKSFSEQISPKLASLENFSLDFRGCEGIGNASLIALSNRIKNLKAIKYLSLDFEGCPIAFSNPYHNGSDQFIPVETLLTQICSHLNKNIKTFYFDGDERKTIVSESSHIYPMKRDHYDSPKRSFNKKQRTEKLPQDEELEKSEEAQPEINLDEWELEDY